MATLEILVLGPLRISMAGEPITDFKSNKARALLVYLAMEAGKYYHRSILANMLWPDLPDHSGLTNLRDNLSFLRKLVRDRASESNCISLPAHVPYLLITRDTVRFNPESDYSLDAEQLFGQKRVNPSFEETEKALSLIQGEFLEGFALKDSCDFEDWVARKREQVHQTTYNALRTVATVYEKQRQYDKALAVLTQHMAYLPWTEEIYRHLIRLYALNGDYRQALLQYEVCKRVLWDEMGVTPDLETTALYEQIRQGLLRADHSASNSGFHFGEQIPVWKYEPHTLLKKPSLLWIGRAAELLALRNHLDAATGGSGRFVFVRGDIGSGKTALVHHFCRQAMAANPGLIVAQGEASVNFRYDGTFLPVRELIQGLCETSDSPTPCNEISPEQTARAEKLAPTARQIFLQRAPAVFRLFVSPDSSSLQRQDSAGHVSPVWQDTISMLESGLSEKTGQFYGLQIGMLFEQFSKALRFLSWQQPLVLVLDNLQWADESTIQLLHHFGQRLEHARILVICIYRSLPVNMGSTGRCHNLPSLVNELRLKYGENCLDLDRVNGKEFCESLLDVEPNLFEPAFRHAFYELTEGNPLLSIDLLQDLKKRRIVTQDGEGKWSQSEEIAWDRLPPRVEAMLSERISQLDEEHQEYLQVASVQQEQIFPAVVASVLHKDRMQVEQAFHDQLCKQYGLVRAVGSECSGDYYAIHYRFSPGIYRVFLCDRINDAERNFLQAYTASVTKGFAHAS